MWHEINYIWINYFWASLKGNGPEALVQTVVYAGIALALWPAVRKVIRAEAHAIHEGVDKVEKELVAEERKLVAFVRAVVKSPVTLVKVLSRVRVTTKDVKAVDAVGSVVDKVDPALAPEVAVAEAAAKAVEASPAPVAAADTMGAR